MTSNICWYHALTDLLLVMVHQWSCSKFSWVVICQCLLLLGEDIRFTFQSVDARAELLRQKIVSIGEQEDPQ